MGPSSLRRGQGALLPAWPLLEAPTPGPLTGPLTELLAVLAEAVELVDGGLGDRLGLG